MRAVLYDEVGGPFRIADVPEPGCAGDGVLIEVRATGICRSDWHAWRGHERVELPHIGGHEYAGTVVASGPQVRRWSVGDRVTVPFVLGCGVCECCLAGDAQVCPDQRQPGFSDPGSFAERVAVPGADVNLVALPESVEFTAAAALGCRFATAYRAVTAHGRLQPGQWLAVHGCGGVGLSAVMIGVALGARVVAVDVAAGALDRARELGAEAAIDGSIRADTGRAVREITGAGAHVSLDALGSRATAAESIRSLRRRGRHVQVGLLVGADTSTPLPMARVIAWELEIYGSHGMAAVDYPRMLALVSAGTLRPAELIGRTVGLDGIGPALAAMDGPTEPGITVALP